MNLIVKNFPVLIALMICSLLFCITFALMVKLEANLQLFFKLPKLFSLFYLTKLAKKKR